MIWYDPCQVDSGNIQNNYQARSIRFGLVFLLLCLLLEFSFALLNFFVVDPNVNLLSTYWRFSWMIFFKFVDTCLNRVDSPVIIFEKIIDKVFIFNMNIRYWFLFMNIIEISGNSRMRDIETPSNLSHRAVKLV